MAIVDLSQGLNDLVAVALVAALAPLVVAVGVAAGLTAAGYIRDGVMLPATAAALVGAGVLSVLVFPLAAVRLHRSAPLTAADIGVPASGSAATAGTAATAPRDATPRDPGLA